MPDRDRAGEANEYRQEGKRERAEEGRQRRLEFEEAEPDDAYVARQRAEFESHMRWDHPGYRYPAHLTGASAASYPPPPEPEPEAGQ